MKKILQPSIQVLIGYKDVYDDYETVNLHSLLNGIPTLPILHFISGELMKVVYAISDPITNKQQVRDIAHFLPKDRKEKVWDFAKRHACSAYETYGTSLLYGLALMNHLPMEAEDDCLDLCEDEQEPVFKALLYCNQRWTDEVFPPEGTTIPQKSILVDLPIVEFKTYKDFLSQLFKVCQFFVFCEHDATFKNYLPEYYKSVGISDWRDYVRRILAFYIPTLKNRYIRLTDGLEYHSAFFDNYSIDTTSVPQNLWDGHKALNYLRDHFLYKVSDDTYLILNPNFLVDKLYQGLRFEFGRMVVKKKILASTGKPYKDLADFNSVVGTVFSEPHLLYTLLKKVYADKGAMLFTGQYLKDNGVKAEPDSYLRIYDSLFLFEFKDVTMNDDVKYSNDIGKIKSALSDKICRLNPTPKGAGQLRNTIEQIFDNGVMDKLDPDVRNVKRVYQIIITTDRSYSAIGISNMLVELYWDMLKEKPLGKTTPFVSIPIIIEFDTLFRLAYRLHTGKLNLDSLLWEYINLNEHSLSPFASFVEDFHKLKKHDSKEIDFLLGDVIPELIQDITPT